MGVENARACSDNGIGNLMKSDMLSIEFKKEAYYEGQVVEGTIILEPKQNLVMNDILIRFKQTEYFFYVEDEKNVISDINNQVFFEKRLNAGQFLNMGSQMISLTPGSYKFPFQFTLQKNIPPSFEFPFHNRRAALRYLFSAEVLSPYAKATTEKFILMKARPINIPSEIKHENFVKVKNVGIVSRGSSGIALFTMANNYRINDMIPFTVDIYNEECGVRVKEMKITIRRIVTFIKNGKEYQKRTAIIRRRYPTVCEKMTKNSFHYDDLQLRDNELKEAEFNKNMNPYPFIDDLNQLMPNIQTKLIRCEYSLKATTYFDLSVLGKDRPRVEMPIYVTHQLEKEYQYEKDTNQYKGQGQQNAYQNYGKGFDQFAGQGYGGQNNYNGYGPSPNQGGYGQGGYGQNNYGNQNNNNNNTTTTSNASSSDISKSSQFSYEAYIAKKKLNNSTADNKNSSGNNNNYGGFGNNNNNNSWGQGGNYGNYGNNNNNYGNNNNNNYGNYGNSNNNDNFANPFANNSNSNPYGNNNNSNPYANINSNPYGNNNNSNPYGNNNSNPYGNNNNNSNPYGNNPFGNNNNSSPYGNNNNNNSNYNPGSYGGGYGGNNGSANPFGGGSNDFPSMENINNQKSDSQPANPFGDNNSNSNNPPNPFGGNGNSNPYSGGYPGL